MRLIFLEQKGFLVLAVLAALLLIAFFYSRRARSSARPWNVVELALKMMLVCCLCLALNSPVLRESNEQSRLFAAVDVSDSIDETVGEKLLGRLHSLSSSAGEVTVIPFAGKAAATGIDLSTVASFRALKQSFAKLDIGQTHVEQALRAAAGTGGASVLFISDGFETAGNVDAVLPILTGQGTKIFPLLPEDANRGGDTFRISQLYAPLVAPAKKER